ncbi:RNA polymerase sigma factor [Bryobacterales bacterium F-183]|nr:RNA polymerase sigma factor [Bryobacterales bacterium F-183]
MADATLIRIEPDDQLVTRSQGGDQAAFEELVRRHENTCIKLAVSILRDAAEAEDEVQNSLWKAYSRIHQFQQDSKFSTWLSRIVVNQCLMRLRKAKRARLLHLDEPWNSESASTLNGLELPDQDPNPEHDLAGREIKEVLHKEVSRIPPALRKVLELRDVQELPMPEVASRLGISAPAAKSRLLRARQELRNRMRKHKGSEGFLALFA